MAIQTSKAITEIKVLNSGSKELVCEFNIKVTSYDDSDQEGTTVSSEQTIKLETEGRTGAEPDYVAYENLTQAKLEEFGGSELSDWVGSITGNQAVWVESLLNPPTPNIINKALPF